MKQEEVWDGIAVKWSEFRQTPKPAVKEFLEGKTGKILDIGCGSGRHFLKSPTLEFYGTDISKEMVKLAKQKNIAKEIKQSPAEILPFQDNFFDNAIFAASLHCVETNEKRKKAIQELYRVLKPEGQAIITVLSKGHRRVKEKESMIPWTIKEKKYDRYYYVYDAKEISNQFKQAGFKIISLKEDGKNISLIVKKSA